MVLDFLGYTLYGAPSCGSSHTLTVTLRGTGSGDVVSSPVGVDCGGLAACESLKGHTGSHGFNWAWNQSLPSPKLGDCSLSVF